MNSEKWNGLLAIFSDYFEGRPLIEGIRFLLSRARKFKMDFQPIPFIKMIRR